MSTHRKHLINTVAVLCLGLAGAASADSSSNSEMSIAELREYYNEVTLAEKAFADIGRYYSVTLKHDERAIARQGVHPVPASDILLSAALGEGFDASDIRDEIFFSEDLFGDGSRFIVGHIQRQQEDDFVILQDEPGGYRLVFKATDSSFLFPAVFYTKDTEGHKTLMLENVPDYRKYTAITYDEALGVFMTADEREEALSAMQMKEAADGATAYMSEVVWRLDYTDHSLNEDLIGFYKKPGVSVYGYSAMQAAERVIGGREMITEMDRANDMIPLAGFKQFADTQAHLDESYDPNFNPIDLKVRAGVASGKFKIEEKTTAQFGYAVNPGDDARYCTADNFVVNGKEMPLFEGTFGKQAAMLSKKLPFPPGEFEFEMAFECAREDADFKVIFLNEEGVLLPSYDAGIKLKARKPHEGLETKPAAVSVVNRQGDDVLEQVELIDFSAPIRIGDFHKRQSNGIAETDKAMKTISFKFMPDETGLYHFDVRSISNVCRALWQGGECLNVYSYRDPDTGRSTQKPGWTILHPATKITASANDKSQSNALYRKAPQHSTGGEHVTRAVRDNIVSFDVTEADLESGIDITVEAITSFVDAVIQFEEAVIVDAFGQANSAAHWASLTDADALEVRGTSQGITTDMFEAGVGIESSFLVGVRAPSDQGFRPISADDLANHDDLKGGAVEVAYEAVKVGEIEDDTSWIE